MDTRLIGMIVAIAVIWVGFHILSGGDFLTARNLWNLSVQSTSIAIMATGMVLIIVSRNIDLSVGSLLGFLGYVMAMVQTQWIPKTFDLGFDKWYTWLIALAVGVALGAAAGLVFIVFGRRALQGREVSLGGIRGAGARQVLLMVGVMTLHSFAEGVAVGVSFGGGQALATLITIAIAVHNVPEGLAISAVMRPKGASILVCAAWSVFSSSLRMRVSL